MLQELGFESLKSRRWFRRLCCVFKIMKNEAPNYLISLIPEREQTLTQETNIYQSIIAEQIVLSIHFFPCALNDWFNQDDSIRNSESISTFKSKLLSFIRPVQNNIFNIFDFQRLKLLTRLRLGFSHLNEYRFRQNNIAFIWTLPF